MNFKKLLIHNLHSVLLQFVLFQMQKADCLIVGGGIVGVAVARHLQATFPHLKCLLVEKENVLG